MHGARLAGDLPYEMADMSQLQSYSYRQWPIVLIVTIIVPQIELIVSVIVAKFHPFTIIQTKND